MVTLLIALTAFVLILSFAIAFYKTRDPFHPLILTAPMFATIYVYLPVTGLIDGQLFRYLRSEQMYYTQILFLLGTAAFCGGCLYATFRKNAAPKIFKLPNAARERLYFGACMLGALGLWAWYTTLANVGGFVAAYSRAYGLPDSEYGYVRDAVFFTAPAIVLLFTSRLGLKPRIRDIALVVIFAAPLGIHGLIGARRSPVFLLVVATGFGFYMIRHRRPRLLVLISAGIAVGVLMLFLVANRTRIYIGSEWSLDQNPTEYFKVGTGNEYIYGSGAVLHADITDSFYWGRRYLAIIFIRPIPVQLWPNKYEDVGVGRLKKNLGVGAKEFRASLGWAGANGAAPGIVSDLYIEIWWFAVPLMYLLGWCYGRAWWLAVNRGGFPIICYVLMAALSLFMVMQTLEAMLVRLLWMSVPSWIIWNWAVAKKPEVANESFATAPFRNQAFQNLRRQELP